jgi:hypothetical protein
MYWWFLMLLVMQLFAQLEMQGIAWVSYRWILLVTIHHNYAHQKLFLIVACPCSLLSPSSDRHIVKLHIPELSPFTRFDLHIIKLQPRPDFT